MAETTDGLEKRPEKTIEEYIANRSKRLPNGCIEWKMSRPGRYGGFSYKSIQGYAHIRIWEMANGPVPKGLIPRHRCDYTRCVNLDHLELGTKKGNRRDFMGSHPRAREPVLEAARIGAVGVRKFWDNISAEEKAAFVAKRVAARKEKARQRGAWNWRDVS